MNIFKYIPIIFIFCFSVWIAFLPLINRGGFYEEPKVLTFLVASFLAVIYLLIFQKKGLGEMTKADKIYFFWIGILGLASLSGPHPQDSILGGSYRHQGVLFFIGLGVLGKIVRGMSGKWQIVLSRLITLGALLQGILIIYQYLSGGLYFDRPLGSLGEPNAIAGYLILATYFASFVVPKKALLYIFLIALMTKSRIGILINTLVISVLQWEPNKKLHYLYIALIILLGIFILPFERRYDSFTEDRAKYIKYGFEEYLKKPLIGYGAETGEYVYANYYFKRNIDLRPLVIDRSHNLILDILMWSGALGLILFIYWTVEVFRSLDTTKRLVFLGFFVYSMLQPLSVVHWVYFAVLINFSPKLHLHRRDSLV
jgi:hypothetical protein